MQRVDNSSSTRHRRVDDARRGRCWRHCRASANELVAEALVIAFGVIMLDEFRHELAQMTFTQRDNLGKHSLLMLQKEAVDGIGEVARHLLHVRFVRLLSDAGNLNTSRRVASR